MKAHPTEVIYAVLASLLTCAGQASQPQQATTSSFQQAVTIEGYVRYEGGKPAKGYWVSLDSQSYQTQGRTDVIPFDIPRKAAGAVVFNDPNAVQNHFTSARSVKVDSRGDYAFVGLAPGTYLVVVSEKKNGENLKRMNQPPYQLPPEHRIIASGHSQYDVTMSRTKMR